MTKAATLRLSLLVAMGIVPVACGGTTRNEGEEGGNAGQPGSSGSGGDTSVGTGGSDAGSAGDNTSIGGTGVAGSTSKAGAAQGGAAGAGAPSFICKNPKLNPESGLVVCDQGGYVHRPQAFACDNAGGQPGAGGEGGAGGDGSVDPRDLPRATGDVPCTGPGDCAQFQWGYCGGGGPEIPSCRSGCVIDSDCGSGQVCICGSQRSPGGGECHPATCATDADCPGSVCASHEAGGCGGTIFRCITEHDRCASNLDCARTGNECLWNSEEEAHECGVGAVCGRPFLVADLPRLPPVEARRDWSDAPAPRVDHLSLGERAALARHWTKLGRMEHASIAAFARFSLQLLALGAPPDLVDACTRALADETAHAKLCFGIASAYAGRPIGPGPLDVSKSLELASLADIVDLVILEGCIGETSAALDALESAETAADPVIRDAYARIAADEQRHAELAFRFVRWAAMHGKGAAAHVARAIDALPSSRVCDEVVTPCLRALLEACGAIAAAAEARHAGAA